MRLVSFSLRLSLQVLFRRLSGGGTPFELAFVQWFLSSAEGTSLLAEQGKFPLRNNCIL